MAIPPAWENVWISPFPYGHLQATGYDLKGRKQYIYHPEWVKICQGNKFDKLLDFAKALPKIRGQVKADLNSSGMPRRKIIAAVVWLLEHTFIRVGNDEYARENDSFGLTTLHDRHVNIWGDRIRFDFVGKSGIRHKVDIHDPKLAKIIKSCVELPGYELFQYVDDTGDRHAVDSKDINEYLKEVTSEDITAKDFRTWGATLLSALTLEKMGICQNEKIFKKNVLEAVKTVSSCLGNTPSVCRSYYIHPAVIESYKENVLTAFFDKSFKNKIKENLGLTRAECSVATLLQRYS